ncbi:tail fiber protein [Photorhabdus viridis]|uniref:tail fiber protein n=1 Tax=Photorhabdus viridis TaxID=3163327 RepID=UPI0033075A73
MVKKYNLFSAELNLENTDLKSSSPSADDLKKRFKEGSIPLQTDYADLINIADMGRKAVGKAPGQTDNPNSALKLDDAGALSVKFNANGGLKADKDGLSVKIKDKSLLVDTNGLAVNAGRGIRINNDKLEVDNHHGIEIVNEGVKVKAGNGIKVDSNGVSLNIGKTNNSRYSPLTLQNNIFSVQLNDGLVDKTGGITVGQGDGIIVGNQTVSVKPGDGITVDSNGVSIDPNKVLPKGMIVMFSGNSAPTGWALCDGKNDTPDLIDRFILGGNFSGINGKSNDKASGSINAKEFKISTTNKKLTVTIKGTKLSLSQIPEHKHIGGMAYYNGTGSRYGDIKETKESKQIDNNPGKLDFMSATIGGKRNLFSGNDVSPHYLYTSSTGNGGEHTHAVDANANIIPPYYILAFIMKL